MTGPGTVTGQSYAKDITEAQYTAIKSYYASKGEVCPERDRIPQNVFDEAYKFEATPTNTAANENIPIGQPSEPQKTGSQVEADKLAGKDLTDSQLEQLYEKKVTTTTTTENTKAPIDGTKAATAIMLGGTALSAAVTTSAAILILGGGAALAAVPVVGVVALGIWGLSRLFGRNKQQTVTQTTTEYVRVPAGNNTSANSTGADPAATVPADPGVKTPATPAATTPAPATKTPAEVTALKKEVDSLRAKASEMQKKSGSAPYPLEVQQAWNNYYIKLAEYTEASGGDMDAFKSKYNDFLSGNSRLQAAIKSGSDKSAI